MQEVLFASWDLDGFPGHSEVVHGVVEVAVDFLSWVEDAVRIEDLLGFFKKFDDFFAVHLGKIWSTDQSIIVFTRD